MLYRIGLESELPMLPSHIPKRVRTEILKGLIVLDCEYGHDRDYLESGGYSVIAETSEDVCEFKELVNYDSHPCEWATRISWTGYLSALFILNDDFTIMVYMPISIAPEAILRDLED